MEVRTRVLRDQLGVKLAKEANVDFDAPQIVAIESPPAGKSSGERPRTRSGAPRENRGPKRAMQGRPDRGARGAENRFERDAAPRRAPPAPSTPERRRKHVSALRAEIAADAATTRKRIERSATHDRKGRTIAVERMSRTGEEARTSAAPETRPKRAGSRNIAERGGRSFGASGRAGRGDSFGPKRGRAAAGRERPPRTDHKEAGGRPERSSDGRVEGGPRERRFDRPAAKRDGDRRDHGSRAQGAGDPARERKFDRPQGRTRPQTGEGRPPRSDAKTERRFDRPEAKRDGDRRERPSRTRDGADPARERKFDRPQGRTRPQAGEGRPPRSDDKSRGPRSDFKSLRAGGRDGDRPRNRASDTGAKGGAPRGGPSPERRPRPPGKGPPRGADGPRRPPRKS
jgi:23S rRNA pseudouridine2605 synthase